MKQGRKRAGTAGGEHRRDRDRDLEAVPLCPVKDESRGDKERAERTERKKAEETGAAWKHRGGERAAQRVFTTCSQMAQGLRGSAPARNVRVTTAENGAHKSSAETQ